MECSAQNTMPVMVNVLLERNFSETMISLGIFKTTLDFDISILLSYNKLNL